MSCVVDPRRGSPSSSSAFAAVVVIFACGLASGFASACESRTPETLPPIGQVLLYIDTDAPLPAAPGDALGPDDPPPLFERVRIEVFRPGERVSCAQCTHEFDVDRTMVGAGKASVGITTPPHVSGYIARVRMYRAAFVELDQPRADAAIDVTVALPAVNDEGITPVTVMLRTESVAQPLGSLDAPIQPELSAPPPGGRVGTWSGARRVPCVGEPLPGEVCIPGGAFWMGNPALRGYHVEKDSLAFRIASLSPFFLDTAEVDVASFRAAKSATTDDPMRYSAEDGSPGQIIHCTYTETRGNNEALPVTCISWDTARAHCLARGGDLPTEAQHEYAAGALEGRLFPWGDDQPKCADAVFLRAIGFVNPDERCPGGWVTPPGSSDRDRIVRPDGVIVDLGGNVSEHALDWWNTHTEPCWHAGAFFDPVCETRSRDPASKDSHTVMSGSFILNAGCLAAGHRAPGVSFKLAKAAGPAGGPQYAGPMTSTGFRCARSATP